MKLKKFKAIILDMDGVFIDTETLVFDIFRRVFLSFNINLTNEYQYKFIGKPFSSNLDDIRQDFGIGGLYQQVAGAARFPCPHRRHGYRPGP